MYQSKIQQHSKIANVMRLKDNALYLHTHYIVFTHKTIDSMVSEYSRTSNTPDVMSIHCVRDSLSPCTLYTNGIFHL